MEFKETHIGTVSWNNECDTFSQLKTYIQIYCMSFQIGLRAASSDL